MSLRRFCDRCDTEIPDRDRYYAITLQIKSAASGSVTSELRGAFCYSCTKSGQGLSHLMQSDGRPPRIPIPDSPPRPDPSRDPGFPPNREIREGGVTWLDRLRARLR